MLFTVCAQCIERMILKVVVIWISTLRNWINFHNIMLWMLKLFISIVIWLVGTEFGYAFSHFVHILWAFSDHDVNNSEMQEKNALMRGNIKNAFGESYSHFLIAYRKWSIICRWYVVFFRGGGSISLDVTYYWKIKSGP